MNEDQKEVVAAVPENSPSAISQMVRQRVKDVLDASPNTVTPVDMEHVVAAVENWWGQVQTMMRPVVEAAIVSVDRLTGAYIIQFRTHATRKQRFVLNLCRAGDWLMQKFGRRTRWEQAYFLRIVYGPHMAEECDE